MSLIGLTEAAWVPEAYEVHETMRHSETCGSGKQWAIWYGAYKWHGNGRSYEYFGQSFFKHYCHWFGE